MTGPISSRRRTASSGCWRLSPFLSACAVVRSGRAACASYCRSRPAGCGVSARAPRAAGPQGRGLPLKVQHPSRENLRLLPRLDLLGEWPPLHLALGMGVDGRPLVIDIASPSSWHLLAAGEAASGKSELLRSALIALALGTAPLEGRWLGLDLSGRQLALLEAVPHALCELACEPRFADELLDWAVAQLPERGASHQPQSHLVI